ncbi:TPA: terminase [Enterobacter kobei]|nr:terminase [Enterobacter kobei]
MALTPAQRWRKKIAAQQALREKTALDDSPANRSVAVSDLALDIQQLREIEKVEDRIAHKVSFLLPKWLPQVEKYIADGMVYPFPALVYCMVWSFDAGDFERALDYAEISVEQGQHMPENFNTSPGAFIALSFRDWIEMEYGRGNSVEPYFSRAFSLITEVWEVNEELQAIWFVLAARLVLRGGDGKQTTPAQLSNIDQLEHAKIFLLGAEAVYPIKSGAKTLLNKIDARLRMLTRNK